MHAAYECHQGDYKTERPNYLTAHKESMHEGVRHSCKNAPELVI